MGYSTYCASNQTPTCPFCSGDVLTCVFPGILGLFSKDLSVAIRTGARRVVRQVILVNKYTACCSVTTFPISALALCGNVPHSQRHSDVAGCQQPLSHTGVVATSGCLCHQCDCVAAAAAADFFLLPPQVNTTAYSYGKEIKQDTTDEQCTY